MERMLLKVKTTAGDKYLREIISILNSIKELSVEDFDFRSGEHAFVFNPLVSDADNIMENVLREGFCLEYFCRVA